MGVRSNNLPQRNDIEPILLSHVRNFEQAAEDIDETDSFLAAADREAARRFEEMLQDVSGESGINRLERNSGGIDLTQKRLNLQTEGQGIEFNLPFDPNHLDQIPINGLIPIIFQIIPVTDLPLLLGLAEEHPEALSAVR